MSEFTLRGLRGRKADPTCRKRTGKRPPPIDRDSYSLCQYVAELRGTTIADLIETAIAKEVAPSEYESWKTKADFIKRLKED